MAFSVSHLEGGIPTLDTLGQMERKEFSKKQDHQQQPLQQSRPQESTLVIYNSKETTSFEADLDDDILDAYNSTPKAKTKFGRKNELTPDNRPGYGRSPRTIFSPASFSPTVSTPSCKYKGRKNKGTVVCEFGKMKGDTWRRQHGKEFEPVIKQLPPCMEMSTCYMFNQLKDVAEIMNDAVVLLGEEIVSKHSLPEPEVADVPHQNEFVAVGRISCDSEGRLNAKSILLQCSSGRTVQLDVSAVQNCSLFPGQVVAVEGTNPSGSSLAAKQIYCDAVLPETAKLNFSTEHSGPLLILVAAGPFTQSDTMTYQPLDDLVEYISQHEPHIVILIGPFVDITHPHIVNELLAETYQQHFEKMIENFMEPLKMLKVQVILVPSCRDAHHHMVYPAPPFILRAQYNNLVLVSDPCMLDINGIVIGVTSTDILLHTGKEEVSLQPTSTDRLGRIASHILKQRNFYPLYPSAEEVNLDAELWGKYAFMQVTPRILILPSDLRCFIKDLNGCITVNPERLAKGVVGGNFARMEVSCVDGEFNVAAEVVKI